MRSTVTSAYGLTLVGSFACAVVSREIHADRFVIRIDKGPRQGLVDDHRRPYAAGRASTMLSAAPDPAAQACAVRVRGIRGDREEGARCRRDKG
jgi:hypothetical protein